MEYRKVQAMGGGTLLVSLPKAWAKKNLIEKGSTVTVDITSDGNLHIYPMARGERPSSEIILEYPTEYPERLVNEIVGAYLLGYNIIKLMAKTRFAYDDRELIRRAIRRLVGLEIVEEDAKTITVQFLLEPTPPLDPARILRRMHMIASGMCRDAISALIEKDEHLVKVVYERDEEVDRLYFLLVRLIRTASVDSRLASRFSLTPMDCLDYRVAAMVLEAIGDAAVEMTGNVQALAPLAFEGEFLSELGEVSKVMERMQGLAVRAFLNRSISEARQAFSLFGEATSKLKVLEEGLSKEGRPPPIPLLRILSSLARVCRYEVDIADLTPTVYPLAK